MWFSVISIIVSFLLGCQCRYLAQKKGRDQTIWFMAGAFFGIFALLVILFLPARIKVVTVLPAEPPFEAISSLHAEKFWYFLDETKNQNGPMSFSALKSAWNKGTIRKKTFVWNEEMENWKHLEEVIKL